MDDTRTVADLSEELGISSDRLKAPIRHLRERNIGGAINPKKLDVLIKFYAKSSIVEPDIYALVVGQYKAYQDLVTIDDAAKDNLINPRDLKRFCAKLDLNQKNDFLEPNIFAKYPNTTVNRTHVGELVNSFLKDRIAMNTVTEAIVPQFNSSKTLTEKTRPISTKKIKVCLLEPVRSETWKQGNIVGFYRQSRKVGGGVLFPIVAFYNGQIAIVPAVKHDPKTRGAVKLKQRKGTNQPLIWNFSVNEMIDMKINEDHHMNYFINILLSTIESKHVQCKTWIRGTYREPVIQMVTDSVQFDLTDFVATDKDTKKKKIEKQSVFGTPNMDHLKKMILQYKDKYSIFVIEKGSKIRVESRALKTTIAWMPEDGKEILDGLKRLEAKYGIPAEIYAGNMIQAYYETIIKPELEAEAGGDTTEILNLALNDEFDAENDDETE